MVWKIGRREEGGKKVHDTKCSDDFLSREIVRLITLGDHL